MIYNLYLSLIYFILLLLPNLYLACNGFFLPSLYKFVNYSVLIFAILLSLSTKRVFIFFLIFFCMIEIVQIFHVSYFGSFINFLIIKKAFINFTDETQDVYEVFTSEWYKFIFPLFVVIFSYFSIYKLREKFENKIFKNMLFSIILITLVLFSSFRSVFISHTHLIFPENRWVSLLSSITTFGAMFRPTKILNSDNTTFIINKTNPSKIDNIILIIGESASSKYMSIFDYKNKTTPNLERMLKDNEIVAKKGYSSSTSTKMSVGAILNTIYRPEDLFLDHKYLPNLLRLSSEAGYKISILSNQKSNLFYNLGIDSSFTAKFSEDRDEEEFARRKEHILIDELENMSLATKNFIILHNRNLHTPYDINVNHIESIKNHEFEHFSKNVNYERSMLYQDKFFNDLYNFLKTKFDSSSTLMIYVSDHGELFGEGGLYGHNHINLECANIPFLVFNVNGCNDVLEEFDKSYDILSHYDISMFILKLLGYNVKNKHFEKDYRYLMGIDISDERFLKYKIN